MIGWYDGLTAGMARCRTCDRVYHFEMVAWDFEHNLRIYGFKEISRQSYDAFLQVFIQPATSPASASARGDALTLRVQQALATNPERELYIAASDLTESISGVRRITFADWSALLALHVVVRG
jgi:transglutaminase-like putative cysteine protease